MPCRCPSAVKRSGRSWSKMRLSPCGKAAGDEGREEDVIAGATSRCLALPRVKPPADGKGAKDMFVGAPSDGFCNMFGRRTRPGGDAVGDRDVSAGRVYANERHSSS